VGGVVQPSIADLPAASERRWFVPHQRGPTAFRVAGGVPRRLTQRLLRQKQPFEIHGVHGIPSSMMVSRQRRRLSYVCPFASA
jgi:hypothetical protein